MNYEIESLEKFLANSSVELHEGNIEQMIYPKEALSEKLISLTAKENSLEDCMMSMKKAYEKDCVGLNEFLQDIRRLAGKQFMCIAKRNKLMASISGQH
mmetsp:Transcript_46078/g.33860  ORF Transcript_46078/g.33860 Transcript_46078/m.33860 type:complete len:99 (-) Transcript_46078:29-325(-)